MKKKTTIAELIFFMLLVCPVLVGAQQLLPMPKPTHTEKGVPTAKLSLVKKIQPDFEDDLFFALPWKMTVGRADKKGRFYFYMYDFKLIRIFIFNEKCEYVGQFLEHGQGPSEVLPNSPGNKDIYAAPDGNLYVSESIGNKIIQFSPKGKYIKDIKMPWDMRTDGEFPPLIDKKGFFYRYSTNNGIVDKLDGKMNRVHTYLDKKLNSQFVVFKAKHEKLSKGIPGPKFWLMPGRENVFYDITSDDHLLIYLYRSSTAYLFKNDNMVRKFDILIDSVLPGFKKRAEQAIEQQKSMGPGMIRDEIMFSGCIVDQDEPYFYLMYRVEENHALKMYQFDLKGKLVQVIKTTKFAVYAKRHDRFFGLGGGFNSSYPVILKKEAISK